MGRKETSIKKGLRPSENLLNLDPQGVGKRPRLRRDCDTTLHDDTAALIVGKRPRLRRDCDVKNLELFGGKPP